MYKVIAVVAGLLLVGSLLFAVQYFIRSDTSHIEQTTSESGTSQSTVSTGAVQKTVDFTVQELPFELSVPEEFEVGLFADQIGKVRDLAFSPEGVLLASVPSEGRVIALVVGTDGSVSKKVVVDELSGPHGIAFYNDKLFIAEDNRLGRYSWNGSTSTATFEKELFNLPSGGHDAHTIVFGKDGALYVKIGSVCNVCNETDPWRATVIKTDAEGNNPQVFAKGVRNAAFMTVHPETGEIWATENGRDHLGDDLPQEEINIIKEGKNYGWPNCYGDRVVDTGFYKGSDRSVCATTEVAIGFMQAHSAPLGLNFIPENFSAELKGDLLVAFHGSWNRSVPTGYKVVRLNLENGQVKEQSDFLTGFAEGRSDELGRPVDVEFDKEGNLFVSDDKSGAIYVISKK